MNKLASSRKAAILDADDPILSIRKQCELIDYNRSNYYYTAHPRVSGSLEYKELIMQRLDYWSMTEPKSGKPDYVTMSKYIHGTEMVLWKHIYIKITSRPLLVENYTKTI